MDKLPLLSVLVPTLWSRRELFAKLYDKLERISAGYPVEILALLDNRKRTIGAKCNSLIEAANGRFLTFVDDDDDVSVGYVEHIMQAIETNMDVHVVNYPVSCRLEHADGAVTENIVVPSIKNDNEEFHPSPLPVLRKPLQTSVWRSDIAKSEKWADSQYEADSFWAKRLWPKIETEHNIGRILYYYRWSATKTEAK